MKCPIGHFRFAERVEEPAKDRDAQNTKLRRAIGRDNADLDLIGDSMIRRRGSTQDAAFCCAIRCARLLIFAVVKKRARMLTISLESRSTLRREAETLDTSLTKAISKVLAIFAILERQGSKRDRGAVFQNRMVAPTVLQPFLRVSVS